MKDRVTNIVVGSASGMGAALAGARWWAVLLMVLVAFVSNYGAVMWLVTHSPHPRRITTFLITWEGSLEPEEPPPSDRDANPP